jgi:8-oxo-dGTP pyrophosphatase MutT (NUDIX family)
MGGSEDIVTDEDHRGGLPRSRNGPKVRVSAFICRGGTVLLANQRRRGRDVWLLPGGGVERGEALAEALEREVFEETGLRVVAGREPLALIQAISPDHGATRHLIEIVFEASPQDQAALESRDPDDWGPRDPAIVHLRWFGPSDLERVAIHPPIHTTLAAWARAREAQVGSPLAFFASEPLWAAE